MRTKIVIAVILTLAVAAAVVVFINFQGSPSREPAKTVEPALLPNVDRKLSEEDKKIYADRLLDVEKRLLESKDEQTKFDLLMFKGFQLQGLGKLGEAATVFLEAAGTKPGNYDVYISLHLVYLEAGEYKTARQYILKSISLKADNTNSWNRYILLEKERFNSSYDHIDPIYQEALEKTGNNIDMLVTYARFLDESGKTERSIEYWKKAAEANPASKNLYQEEIDRLSKISQ